MPDIVIRKSHPETECGTRRGRGREQVAEVAVYSLMTRVREILVREVIAKAPAVRRESSEEVGELGSWFDRAVFSCEVRYKIYLLV